MTDTPNTFTVGEATITPVARITNRARANFRRIRKLLNEHEVPDDSAFEFAYITAYSRKVAGGDFIPPSQDSPASVIIRAYESDAWQDFDAELTDVWVKGLVVRDEQDAATSPVPLDDDADPNSSSADGNGKNLSSSAPDNT